MVRAFTNAGLAAAAAGALAAVSLLLLAALSGPAGAAGYEVTTEDDSGPGSLRQAIADANASPGADEISFSEAVSTITLGSTLPEVTDPAGLTIDGGGDVTVSGGGQVRVLIVSFVRA